jgi:hypothetical protein
VLNRPHVASFEGRTSPNRDGRSWLAALSAVVLGAVLIGVGAMVGSAGPAWAAGSSPSPTCTGTIGGLLVSGGSGQAARAGTAFAAPLAAEVVDTGGCPIANVDVEFVAPTSGASATFPGAATTATVASGSDGVANAPSLTANDVSGSYSVLAEVASTGIQAAFALTNTTSGVASNVGVSAGNDQSAPVGEQFSVPLAVNVLDAYGAPVADANVSFNIVTTNGAGAGFVGGGSSATAQTDEAGTATSPLLVAGTTAGVFTVQAIVSGVSKTTTFTLTDLASSPYSMAPGAGTSQEAQAGNDFAVPLAVTVTDSDSNPVAGTKVTFSAPGSGPSGVFAGHGTTVAVLTNSKGVAVAPNLSANQVAGGFIVTARVAGLSTGVTFAMVNVARGEASTVGPAGNYWLATANGHVVPSGTATQYAAVAGRAFPSHVVSMAATPDGGGYWLVTTSGQVYPFGDARSYGPKPNSHLAAPVVGIAPTRDGHGYWLATSTGAVYAFGDARYYGSEPGHHVVSPIVGIAPTPDGHGYWLVARDGGVFAFGQATFYGSSAHLRLVSPIVGVAAAPVGRGYWLVARDGGVFAFGQATFYGSATRLTSSPVVAVIPTPDGGGYWVVSANGTVTGFGDAGSQGSALTKGSVVAGAAFS